MMSGIATEREVAAVLVERPGVMGRLEATRREFDRCRTRLKLSHVLLAEFALASALVLADWIWVLPTAVRAVGLLAMIGLAASMLARSRRPIGREAAAVQVETHFPELGQRIIFAKLQRPLDGGNDIYKPLTVAVFERPHIEKQAWIEPVQNVVKFVQQQNYVERGMVHQFDD